MKYRNHKNAEATARFWGKSLERSERYAVEEKEDNLDVYIYDIIGWPFNDVGELVQQLSASRASQITVRINSPGGDVFDGLALYNALQSHAAHVTTRVEGLAASMASAVALAGDEVTAHKNAMMMIHEPWVLAAGNQHELREIADILSKISGNLLDIYYAKTGRDKRKLKQEMEDETWFTAEEARDRKLIDTVLDAPAAKAAFDLTMFAHAPEGYTPEGRELTEREIEHALRDAGASRSCAKQVVAGNFKSLREAEIEATNRAVKNVLAILKG